MPRRYKKKRKRELRSALSAAAHGEALTSDDDVLDRIVEEAPPSGTLTPEGGREAQLHLQKKKRGKQKRRAVKQDDSTDDEEPTGTNLLHL